MHRTRLLNNSIEPAEGGGISSGSSTDLVRLNVVGLIPTWFIFILSHKFSRVNTFFTSFLISVHLLFKVCVCAK